MAATGTPTPNIGLRCPQGTDPASVDDINYNSGVIDTKLGAVGNTSVQEQINTLNSNLTSLIIEVQTSGVASNAEAVISFPSGYTKANTRAVYAYLYISSANPRYPNAVDILYIDDSGIHVKNVGGASGTVVVGIMQK